MFGNNREQFLAHRIIAKPDFDENISAFISDEKIMSSLAKKGFVMLDFNEENKRQPFSWNTNEAVVKDENSKLVFQSHKTFYLEFTDLD